MQTIISQRFLIVPVSDNTETKKIYFYKDKELVLDLDVKLDPVRTQFFYYYDMKRFLGCELNITTEPHILWSPEFDNTKPKCHYMERLRPDIHFTAQRGWINDPNGLLFYNGQYHMFFQHNPVGKVWGNMHWGHAVSKDLFHWEELDIALEPDLFGPAYSGSAIVDFDNRTGLQTGEHPPILFFYTAAGGESTLSKDSPTTQCLAYSTDGAETFRKYADNPILPQIVRGNRDPKVIYDDETDHYYMALYLEPFRFGLFLSKDLLHWTKHQEVELAGDYECPDFYPLYLGDEKYWVYSAAGDRYRIGKMKDGIFYPMQVARPLHYGKNSYAAQTFSNVPDPGRRIRIAWNTSTIPGEVFQGAMCIPTEMFLKKIDEDIYLCTQPVREKSILVDSKVDYAGKAEAGKKWSIRLTQGAKAIDLKLHLQKDIKLQISLFGLTVEFDSAENKYVCREATIPAYCHSDEVHVYMIMDCNAIELFSDYGQAHACIEHTMDFSLDELVIEGMQGNADFEIHVDNYMRIYD